MVKPDRFKPTNFAFVFANEEDLTGTDLTSRSFVLPIPSSQTRVTGREDGPKPIPVKQSEPDSVEDEKEPAISESRILPMKAIRSEEAPEEAPIGGFQARAPMESEHVPAKPFISSTGRPAPLSGDAMLVKRWLAAIAVLTLAAVVTACYIWFFWNYVEQPVELHARKVPGGIVVSWPPAETKTTESATLRIWQGNSAGNITLSAAQKQSGQKTLAVTGDDVTIELIAHRWMHERRGVIRVLLSNKQSPRR
jgi:hypothetical protein